MNDLWKIDDEWLSQELLKNVENHWNTVAKEYIIFIKLTFEIF